MLLSIKGAVLEVILHYILHLRTSSVSNMNQSQVQRPTHILEEASGILRNDSSQAALPLETELNANNINASDVFRSARSMLNASSSNGVFRKIKVTAIP